MRSSPFTIVDCSYVLQHHCLWQYRIMLFSKTQSLYKRFDGAVAPKDRNKKMKKRVSKDMCVVQACVVFISLITIVANLVADILYALIDPRIRY